VFEQVPAPGRVQVTVPPSDPDALVTLDAVVCRSKAPSCVTDPMQAARVVCSVQVGVAMHSACVVCHVSEQRPGGDAAASGVQVPATQALLVVCCVSEQVPRVVSCVQALVADAAAHSCGVWNSPSEQLPVALRTVPSASSVQQVPALRSAIQVTVQSAGVVCLASEQVPATAGVQVSVAGSVHGEADPSEVLVQVPAPSAFVVQVLVEAQSAAAVCVV